MVQAPTSDTILEWYDRHARALPWRVPPAQSRAGVRQDPYKVWLSEIMLQQTTVAAVIPYFEHFTTRWPTVAALASATDDEIRAAWAGLGYYRRAANLHACAKQVAEAGGAFPTTAAGLAALPGIGAYTSAAIASIAFGEAASVVDGNIERVIARTHRIEDTQPRLKRRVAEHVSRLVPADRPGDFAQAMMDLGATICTPRKPACALCPWREGCQAVKHGDQERFPVKAPKKAKPHRRGTALVHVRPSDGAVWCERRPETGLLAGMTQMPTSEWTEAVPDAPDATRVGPVEHVFTHFALTLDVYKSEGQAPPSWERASDTGWWSPPEQLAGEALPTVMLKVLRAALPDRADLRLRPQKKAR
ncbi:MAG: A/G-specific adenine glycosylase [Devosiaceae bacterium]|nr:A/G-specific adenine glycosylase [Devosiaceae bacterium MH13]